MRWTSQEEETAFRMKREGASGIAIGKVLRRHPDVVRKFFERKRAADETKRSPIAFGMVRQIRTPQEVLAERDRRLAAPRTLEMEMLGDPKFGQSALEHSAQ